MTSFLICPNINMIVFHLSSWGAVGAAVKDRGQDGRYQRDGGRRGRFRPTQRKKEDPTLGIVTGRKETADSRTRSETVRRKGFSLRTKAQSRETSDIDALTTTTTINTTTTTTTTERRNESRAEVLGQHGETVDRGANGLPQHHRGREDQVAGIFERINNNKWRKYNNGKNPCKEISV